MPRTLTAAAVTPFSIRSGPPSSPLAGLRVLNGGSAAEADAAVRPPTKRRTTAMPLLPVAYRGSFLRRLLAPRRPVEQALLSVIQETYLAGAGTRNVDALAESVGLAATDAGETAHQAREWDVRVDAYRQRPLRDVYPYLLVTETPVLVRAVGGAQTVQFVVAVGRTSTGNREVVGFAIRPDASGGTFWNAFFTDLRDRGLRTIEVLTSEPIDGLLAALVPVFPTARWQRCREGFIADALQLVPQAGRSAVAASLRGVFCQRDAQGAAHALDCLRVQYEFAYPELVDALDAPLGSLLTYYQLPAAQRRSLSSMSALAALQRELRQSCQLVGIFPHERALLRLGGAVLQEISDEWVARATPRRRRPTAAAVWEARWAWGRAGSAAVAA